MNFKDYLNYKAKIVQDWINNHKEHFKVLKFYIPIYLTLVAITLIVLILNNFEPVGVLFYTLWIPIIICIIIDFIKCDYEKFLKRNKKGEN